MGSQSFAFAKKMFKVCDFVAFEPKMLEVF